MRTHIRQRTSSLHVLDRTNADKNGEPSLSLGDLTHTLFRNKWFIVSCVLLSAMIAGLYLWMAKPIYEAAASLRIDPSRASSLGLSDLLSEAGGGGYSGDALQTEIVILKSDVVAISALGSLSDADFKELAHVDKSKIALVRNDTASTPAQELLLTHFRKALSVKQIEGTQLVAISFRDPNPRIAALMANSVVSAYRKQSFDSRYESVSQVSDWLSSEMDTLKDRASEAQRKLAAFQEKNNILGTDPANNTTIDRLRLLNTRLAEAQSERIVKEAQMRASQVQSPAVLAALFPDANLTALQSEEATLYAQYSQLSTKFGANYPPLIELKKQMQKINEEMTRSVENSKNGIKEQYQASAQAEGMLQHQYDLQTQKAYSLNRGQAEYAVLQAEGTSSRELYDTLQYKLQQAGIVAGLNGVNTMSVDVARVPLHAVEPKPWVILGFGLAVGLFVGVGASFFKDAVSEKVQDPEQLERALGYPLLAIIPHLTAKVPTAVKGELVAMSAVTRPEIVTYSEPMSRGAEAYRTLRNSLLLSSLDVGSKTILITSTLAGEGKSSVAVNYAIVLAQKGAKVLIVDGDLRRPTLHTRFGVKNESGLANLLLEPGSPHTAIKPLASLPNLYLLTAGKQIPLPSEALSSTRFHSLLKGWEEHFDYVLIDSAPLLIVSDSLPLASMADSVVLVTRYNFTHMKAAVRVRKLLSRIDANVAGVVINNVPPNGESYGGNGHGYYQ